MRYQKIPITRARRFICDLMWAARSVPSVSVERRTDLGRLFEVRSRMRERPSWAALFIKGYALAAIRFPELRRAYLKLPFGHLGEYPCSSASLAVERADAEGMAVFFARIPQPERLPVSRISAAIREYQHAPVENCREFQRALRIVRLPWLLRRIVWWFILNSGRNRGNYLGTFAVTSYARNGAQSLHPLSPCTGTLNYGQIDSRGGVTVRLVYDHRVLDGATVARFLQELERVMNEELVIELAESGKENTSA